MQNGPGLIRDGSLRRCLIQAIAAVRAFETDLRAFSEEGDDAEVQSAFRDLADLAATHQVRLSERSAQTGDAPADQESSFAAALRALPAPPRLGDGPDERLAQNLITAFAVEQSECALYEALAATAAAAGDPVTEALARDIQLQAADNAKKLWKFLPSRAKIAFNVRTAGEIDPAVETKTVDDRGL